MPSPQEIEGGISALIPSRFTQVWFIDTEFQAVDGEQNVPVCLCAYELRSKRKVEMFFDRPHENIFDDPNALFVCYNAVAEWKTFLALGWTVPSNTIDLYFEYLNEVNGVWRGPTSLRELGTGLVDAMREHGLDPMDAAEKDAERQYIIANGTQAPAGITQDEHAKRIVSYCWTDVRGTFQLAKRMLPGIDFDQALWRGAYTRPAAHYEHNGLPVNVERYQQINARRSELQIEIAEKIEEKNGYGVYAIEGTKKNPRQRAVFKMKQFGALLERLGILELWPKTDTGQPMTDDEEVFQPMAKVHPYLEDLRQARKSLNDLGRFGSHLGKDGFNRAPLWAFGTVTSRNNPKAKAFLLSRPHWVRNLITPLPGMAIVHADIVGAESWLAAGFSGDPELMRIYTSGADQYIEFASVTGAVPKGTVRDKSDKELERKRGMHKTALLAINYGVKEKTLAQYLGVQEWKAAAIINAHKEAYGVYWAWAEDQVSKAKALGYVETDFGWHLDAEHAPFNTLLNFPQQAACGEVLRAASVFLCDRGWGPYLAAPHHDAIYMHVPIELAEEARKDLEECFIEAGDLVMGDPNFTLRVDSGIELYPRHFDDPDGAALWKIVSEFFGWKDADTLPERVNLIEEEVTV
jgi:DNA polymerase I